MSCCWWLDGIVHLLGLGVPAGVGGDNDDGFVDDYCIAAAVPIFLSTILVLGLSHLHTAHLLVVHHLTLLTLLALLHHA